MGIVQTALLSLGAMGVLLVGFDVLTGWVLQALGPHYGRLVRGDFRTDASLAGATALLGSEAPGLLLLSSYLNIGRVPASRVPLSVYFLGLGMFLWPWIFALALGSVDASLALVTIALSLPFRYGVNPWRRGVGEAVLGAGVLMLGLALLNGALPAQTDVPVLIFHLRRLTGSGLPALGVFFLFGLLLTPVIRSPLAVTGLFMALSFQGWMTVSVSAAALLGSSLGKCLIPLLALRRMSGPARLPAVLYCAYHAIAVVLCLISFDFLLLVLRQAVPAPPADIGAAPTRLALFQSIYTLIYALAAFPVALFSRKTLGQRKAGPGSSAAADSGASSFALRLLDPTLPDALESNLIIIRGETVRFLALVRDALMRVMNAVALEDRVGAALADQTQDAHALLAFHKELDEALTGCMRLSCDASQAERIHQLQRVLHESRRIFDSCREMGSLLDCLIAEPRRSGAAAKLRLVACLATLLDFMALNRDRLAESTEASGGLAAELEASVERNVEKLRKKSRKEMEKQRGEGLKGELMYWDFVRRIEEIGLRCASTARAVDAMDRAALSSE